MTGKKNLNGVEYERIYRYKESLAFEINVLKILEQSQKSYKCLLLDDLAEAAGNTNVGYTDIKCPDIVKSK